jgi:hypothetical protein
MVFNSAFKGLKVYGLWFITKQQCLREIIMYVMITIIVIISIPNIFLENFDFTATIFDGNDIRFPARAVLLEWINERFRFQKSNVTKPTVVTLREPLIVQ